ncbi:protein pygopus [Phymastichus coffea]|uniref:protein pygopus n=1 Tax=Phymastichus coffea TaxID=108790 RepID=UPI00273BE632|nr:protein pygopus [Phymastichus coffea]XP_058809990.1 protein pygopus [Phymastichus coffea]
MELGGIGIGMGVGIGIGVGSSPPPSTTSTVNPKKKRRTNANNTQSVAQRAPTIQDFVPPPLSGFGDTVVASNPFDDTPSAGLNTGMHNGPQQMLPHHPHHMGNPQLRGMNPMSSGNMNPMMPHMGGVNSMNNPGMGNHMGHIGNIPNANLPPVNSMNPMNNMRSNMPQGNMPPMNNHMSMNHMMNSPISGPTLNSPMNGMNHNLGSPMGGPIGSPINNMSPNHMASSTMSVSGINPANAGLPHNAPQPHPNHLNNIRMNRPHNMPMTAITPTVPNPMLGNNQLNNISMIRSQINNMQNINMNQRNQMGHLGNPMGNVPNNLSGKSPSHDMNISNALPQHRLQAPSLGPKPIPESTGKVYPPDQPMVFNHQNPNAPPISPCGVCHKEVHANDQAILCESGCNFWFHRRCTGLTEVAFELIMSEVCAEWACDRCMSSKNVSLVKFKP